MQYRIGRTSFILLIFLVALSACGLSVEETEPQATAVPSNTAVVEAESSATTEPSPTTPAATATVPATQTSELPTFTPFPVSPTPATEVEPLATAGMALNDLSITPADISLFPVPAVYAGDRASIQIAPNIPRGLAPNDVDVRILVDGVELVAGSLNRRKLSGDTVGLYEWVWDTIDQQGSHTITAVLDPQDLIQIGDENPNNNQATTTVVVEPRELLPNAEANATWITADTECCKLHVVSGTAAHRDLDQLILKVDTAFAHASTKLTEPLIGPYNVYLINRVIGQGGYATDEMVVSYLDRDYAGGGFEEVLVHEAVHLIDQQFAPDRITFLSEGVAVWVTGGHYKQEDLGQRMAALVEMGRYVPLAEAIDNFFATQHEISYLEAASFVEYLVETYGWSAVHSFYSNASADDAGTLSRAIDKNLRIYFSSSLEEVEADWLEYLSNFPRDRPTLTNLQSTIQLYDVMRRYQTMYDPTAYYLYAWLPSPELAVQLDATADFSRHPDEITNVALETMLKAAYDALSEEDYDQVNALVISIDRVIKNNGKFLDPLAKSYHDIIQTASESGYEIQQLRVTGNRAEAQAIGLGEKALSQQRFILNVGGRWILVE